MIHFLALQSFVPSSSDDFACSFMPFSWKPCDAPDARNLVYDGQTLSMIMLTWMEAWDILCKTVIYL